MPHWSTIRRRAMLADLSASLNGGSLQWRTGAQEATPETAAAGTLLCTFTLNATFAPASVGADGASQILTANATNSPQNAVASGVAAHYRILTSGSVCVGVGTIGTSGADINLSSTTIVSGVAQAMTALSIPFPY